MEKKKLRIVKTSIKLFRQKGYKETTLRDIAKKLGVTAPALYNFISKKDEILVLVCEELWVHFRVVLEQVQAHDGSDLSRLNFFLARHLETVYTNYELYETALRYWQIADDQVDQRFSKHMKVYIDTFETLANKLIPKENLETYFNPNIFPLIAIQISNQLPKWLDPSYKPFDFDTIAVGLSSRLLNGYSS